MRKGIGIFILFVLVGGGGVLFWKWYRPTFFENFQRKTSDAVSESRAIRIGGDNYLGYFFITSPEMRKQSARTGLRIDFRNDGGAYAERLEKFNRGEYDCIVLPINSYLQHGAPHKYPGVILAPIAESGGADGMVGFGDALTTGNINTDLNDPNLTFVYTPDSPSSFLLQQVITHFDLFNLRGDDSWRLEVNSSEEVLKKARNREGDVFVLWEPDLSKALEIEGMKYIWGSDKFSGLIIDVFVFRRDFLKDNRRDVTRFFETYYRVMSIYSNNRSEFVADMANSAELKEPVIREILDKKKIKWYDLREAAAQQFGIQTVAGEETREGIVDAILACTDIFIRDGVFPKDPTKGDPYLLTDKSVVEELAKKSVAAAVAPSAMTQSFESMSDDEWSRMKETGTLRVEPIDFQFGVDLLDTQGKAAADQIAVMLVNNYPGYWVSVTGHTGSGNEDANRKLSLRRAETVKQYLVAVHNINPNRLRAVGVGSSRPPQRKPGENERSYRYRLSRVEFVLLERSL